MDIPADPLLGLTAEAAREEPDFGHRFVAMDGFGGPARSRCGQLKLPTNFATALHNNRAFDRLKMAWSQHR
jgi:hypothetical protein